MLVSEFAALLRIQGPTSLQPHVLMVATSACSQRCRRPVGRAQCESLHCRSSGAQLYLSFLPQCTLRVFSRTMNTTVRGNGCLCCVQDGMPAEDGRDADANVQAGSPLPLLQLPLERASPPALSHPPLQPALPPPQAESESESVGARFCYSVTGACPTEMLRAVHRGSLCARLLLTGVAVPGLVYDTGAGAKRRAPTVAEDARTRPRRGAEVVDYAMLAGGPSAAS